jgi:hypothetical protein
MIKEIADVVKNLKPNEISNPIQTKFGWHLVKFSETRDAKPLAFEAVKENIREQLIQDKLNEINAKYIKEAKIKILVELKQLEQKEHTPKSEEPDTANDSKADDSKAEEGFSASQTEEEKNQQVEEKSSENQVEEKKSEIKTDEKKSKQSTKNNKKKD